MLDPDQEVKNKGAFPEEPWLDVAKAVCLWIKRRVSQSSRLLACRTLAWLSCARKSPDSCVFIFIAQMKI